eukprot:gene47610-biopygen38095
MSIPFRLVENLRTPGYLPFYLCLHGGFWAREGLDVQVITAPATAETPRLLLSGQADAAWGGPMRVMMHHDADPACPLVCFAQAVSRDPFMLVGRTPNPAFRFADLAGLRVGVATDVPTPWMTFQDDLRRAGFDPATLIRAPDLPMAQNAAAFAAGAMDVVQLFEPYADQLVQSSIQLLLTTCLPSMLPFCATSCPSRAQSRRRAPTPMQLNSLPWPSHSQLAGPSAPSGCHSASSQNAAMGLPVTWRITMPMVSGHSSL